MRPQRLITQARTLYVDEELGLDLTNTVYALDSTTIALCLSVFPWAHFRTTKAAVKMHTLLDLRGNIPSFIHISDGKLHDVHALVGPQAAINCFAAEINENSRFFSWIANSNGIFAAVKTGYQALDSIH